MYLIMIIYVPEKNAIFLMFTVTAIGRSGRKHKSPSPFPEKGFCVYSSFVAAPHVSVKAIAKTDSWVRPLFVRRLKPAATKSAFFTSTLLFLRTPRSSRWVPAIRLLTCTSRARAHARLLSSRSTPLNARLWTHNTLRPASAAISACRQ